MERSLKIALGSLLISIGVLAMSVGKAHEICDRLEAAIKQRIAGAMTTIHIEPEYKARRNGAVTG